jgi:hypothetical protein
VIAAEPFVSDRVSAPLGSQFLLQPVLDMLGPNAWAAPFYFRCSLLSVLCWARVILVVSLLVSAEEACLPPLVFFVTLGSLLNEWQNFYIFFKKSE